MGECQSIRFLGWMTLCVEKLPFVKEGIKILTPTSNPTTCSQPTGNSPASRRGTSVPSYQTLLPAVYALDDAELPAIFRQWPLDRFQREQSQLVRLLQAIQTCFVGRLGGYRRRRRQGWEGCRNSSNKRTDLHNRRGSQRSGNA